MPIGTRLYTESNANTDVLALLLAPVVLYEVDAQNNSGGALWLQIFNKAGLPVLGDAPIYSFRIADASSLSFAPPGGPTDMGRACPLGCVAAWSATQDTYGGAVVAGPIWLAGRELGP